MTSKAHHTSHQPDNMDISSYKAVQGLKPVGRGLSQGKYSEQHLYAGQLAHNN